jgi:RNA polymerase sigma-70 factor (ECF subfamily)
LTESGGSRQLHDVKPADATARTRHKVDADATASAPVEPAESLDFRALFEQHFAYVWHTLRRLGVRERDLEDVAHDVFVEVFRARDRYDPARPLRAWLFGFTFRIAAGHRRRASHRLEVLDGEPERPARAPTALERLIDGQALGAAHRALEAIDLDRRAVFLMHEVDGFSIREVAEVLSIPLNTAYSRLRLAREEFRERIRRLRSRER